MKRIVLVFLFGFLLGLFPLSDQSAIRDAIKEARDKFKSRRNETDTKPRASTEDILEDGQQKEKDSEEYEKDSQEYEKDSQESIDKHADNSKLRSGENDDEADTSKAKGPEKTHDDSSKHQSGEKNVDPETKTKGSEKTHDDSSKHQSGGKNVDPETKTKGSEKTHDDSSKHQSGGKNVDPETKTKGSEKTHDDSSKHQSGEKNVDPETKTKGSEKTHDDSSKHQSGGKNVDPETKTKGSEKTHDDSSKHQSGGKNVDPETKTKGSEKTHDDSSKHRPGENGDDPRTRAKGSSNTPDDSSRQSSGDNGGVKTPRAKGSSNTPNDSSGQGSGETGDDAETAALEPSTSTMSPPRKGKVQGERSKFVPVKNFDFSTFRAKGPIPANLKERLSKNFDRKSRSPFDGSLFDDSRRVSAGFVKTLPRRLQDALNVIQTKYKDDIALYSNFRRRSPESLQLFIGVFARMDKGAFNKLLNSPPDTIDRLAIAKVPLDVLAALKLSTVKSRVGRLMSGAKQRICEGLQRDETSFSNTRLIERVVNCIKNKPRMPPKKNLLKAIAKNRIAADNRLTAETCRRAIEYGYVCGLSVKIIKTCPAQILKVKMHRIKCGNKRLKRVLVALVYPKGRITGDDIRTMKGDLKALSVDTLKRLSGSAVTQNLGDFAEEAGNMTAAQRRTIGKKIKAQTNVKSLSGNDLANALPFIVRTKKDTKNLDPRRLAEITSKIGKMNFDKKTANLLAKKLREADEYKNPKGITTAKLRKVGNLLGSFGPKFIKKLDLANFDDMRKDGAFKNMTFVNKAARRAVAKKCIEDIGDKLSGLKKEDIKQLGELVKDFKPQDIAKMDSVELTAAIAEMEGGLGDFKPRLVNAMLDKVKQAGNLGDSMEKVGKLFKEISVKTLRDLPDGMFKDMSGKTPRQFKCKRDNCAVLYKHVREQNGSPGLDNANFTKQAVQNLNDVLCGMPESELKAFPPTDVIEVLVNLECMTFKQMMSLYQKVMFRLGLYGDTDETVTVEDIWSYGPALKYTKLDDLKSFDDDTMKELLEVIGTEEGVTDTEARTEMTKDALRLMKKDSGAITSDDIDQLGTLACYLPDERVNSIDEDGISDMLSMINEKCSEMPGDKRKIFAKAALDKMNIDLNNADTIDEASLIEMGVLVADIEDHLQDKIPQEILASIASEVLTGLNERQEKDKAMDKRGFKSRLSAAERADRRSKEDRFKSQCINAFVSSNRRKRSTPSLTCSDMQLLGSGVTAMTTDQIEAITDSDFLDCVSNLGSYSSWTSQQLTSLLNVAKRAGIYNTINVWTADNVFDAGKISQGMTASELLTLPALTTDSMAAIGSHEGWTEAQLSAGFSRWLALNKQTMAGTITSSELLSLGHFACGATTNHIGEIDATVYSHAASYIGELTSCLEEQLEAYAALAKTAFGEVATWDNAVMSTVGSVIGGLSADEISTLTTDQIAAIEPLAISQIPSSAFVGFSPSQLESLSITQAQSTTANQQAGLNQAQLSALARAGATLHSSGACIKISAVLTVFPLIVAYIVHL